MIRRNDSVVGIWRSPDTQYAQDPPFHPSIRYPEYPFAEVHQSGSNPAYQGVRDLMGLLGLDAKRRGQPNWNPLGDLIRPGDSVLLKPNLIRAALPTERSWPAVVTHASVVRAVLDYVSIALRGRGKITVADGPDTEQDFDLICQQTGLAAVVDFHNQHSEVPVTLVDPRAERWFDRDGVIMKRMKAAGDPLGEVTIDLGSNSSFEGQSLVRRYYGADYDIDETNRLHDGGHHVYSVSRTAMQADVIINLPKMKTHKKVGVTLSLKNLVGLNTHRNALPHYALGFPSAGGDQYPARDPKRRFEAFVLNTAKPHLAKAPMPILRLARLLKVAGAVAFESTDRVVRSGNWHGNDTAWRMVLDLNRVILQHDGEGKPAEKGRTYLTIIDGIVGGEGNGPMYPDPIYCGVLVGGFNPVAVDTVCATLMGFDFRRIRLLAEAWRIQNPALASSRPESLHCVSNQLDWCGDLAALEGAKTLKFCPHFAWRGAIERGITSAV